MLLQTFFRPSSALPRLDGAAARPMITPEDKRCIPIA